MAVSVVTLWLIYILTILVVAIVLSIPDLRVYGQSLVAVFFATIIAAVVASFVPVEQNTDAEVMSYNFLLIVAYLLPIILLIVIAASGIHHHYTRKYRHMKNVDAVVSCDQGADGEPENCRLDALTMHRGGAADSHVRVSFR